MLPICHTYATRLSHSLQKQVTCFLYVNRKRVIWLAFRLYTSMQLSFLKQLPDEVSESLTKRVG